MLRSPGTVSPFAPPVEDLVDLRSVRAFARRERLGQIEERVPRQISFPRRPFGESLSCGLLQGEPFGLRGPQDERIDHGIHLRLDDLLPAHRKRNGHGLFTCSHYMYLRDGLLAPNDKNSSRLVRPLPRILTIFVRGRFEDPAECAGSPKRDELRIDE